MYGAGLWTTTKEHGKADTHYAIKPATLYHSDKEKIEKHKKKWYSKRIFETMKEVGKPAILEKKEAPMTTDTTKTTVPLLKATVGATHIKKSKKSGSV